MRDWFRANYDETKYAFTNSIIVKSCVKLYHDCWLQRNEYMHDHALMKDRFLQEVKAIQKKFKNSNKIGVNKYLRNCPSNIAVRDAKFIQDWITGFNLIRRSSKKYCTANLEGLFSL